MYIKGKILPSGLVLAQGGGLWRMEQLDSNAFEFTSSGVGEIFMFRVLHRNKRIVSIPGELIRAKPKEWTSVQGDKDYLILDLENRVRYLPVKGV